MSKRHLVLLGAGHTHALALARVAQGAKEGGHKVTLVCGEHQTPYSGMLPGLIAGLYKRPEIFLDVPGIARRCGVEHVSAHADALDLARQQVLLTSGKRIGYDRLSINIGGHCSGSVAGDNGNAMPIKPVIPFLDWQASWQSKHQLTCAIVGGGVAGAELALCIDAYLRAHGRRGGVYLVGAAAELIPGKPSLSKAVSRCFVRRGVSHVLGSRVAAVEPDGLVLASGEHLRADLAVLCTGVRAWPGLAQSGLKVDGKGFALVTENLQSVSHPEVFACGDCGTIASLDIPKSGVYAVRQAPTLAENLPAALADQSLQAWRPQPAVLAIVCVGTRYAIAHRGGRIMQGRLMWWLKDYLDRSFMRKFQ